MDYQGKIALLFCTLCQSRVRVLDTLAAWAGALHRRRCTHRRFVSAGIGRAHQLVQILFWSVILFL